MSDDPQPTVFQVGDARQGWRLDRYLHERIPALSRTAIQRAIVQRVRLDRMERPRPSTRLRRGDEVIVGYPPIHEDPVAIAALQVPTLLEDRWLVAVNKPSGMIVHPSNSVRRASLISVLRRRHPAGMELTLAHRLDRGTSGVLLLAKGRHVARELHELFRRRRVVKRYVAVVEGSVPGSSEEGGWRLLDLPLGLDPLASVPVKRRVDPSGGFAARTRYRVLQRRRDASVLELSPETGRTHQIRVHLQAIGHPILGDRLYGSPGVGAPRLLLHAFSLLLRHPVSGESLLIEAPIPTEMGLPGPVGEVRGSESPDDRA
jgi:23S rRNA pseudouridine1911/1915/1917 synthase